MFFILFFVNYHESYRYFAVYEPGRSVDPLVLAICFAERPPLPKPSQGQIEWMESGIIGFLHYGVNTYTGTPS